VAQWVIVLLVASILGFLLDTRRSLTLRLALMERDLQWISASLQKWGLVPPKKEDKP